jgi:hypothetical protein
LQACIESRYDVSFFFLFFFFLFFSFFKILIWSILHNTQISLIFTWRFVLVKFSFCLDF